MTKAELLNQLHQQYEILSVIELDQWHEQKHYAKKTWLKDQVCQLRRDEFQPQQRLIFILDCGDEYPAEYLGRPQRGYIIQSLARAIWEADIGNFFVLILVNQESRVNEVTTTYQEISPDPVPVSVHHYQGSEVTIKLTRIQPAPYNKYDSRVPYNVALADLTEREQYLLTKSKTFCMYPWVHLHLYPDGQAKPCCMSEHSGVKPLGNANQQSMREIWNSDDMKKLRLRMLNGETSSECNRCYEKEESGFFSGRMSANKHLGHHINRVHETSSEGYLDRFEMVYWDIRFSNLCNLRCRSCGHMFSSSWYQDQVTLAGPEYATNHKTLFYAGRHQTDIWEQLIEHIDHVEQIYFAGGEPLIMEEHYRILEELERREMWHVRLIYNTNFTRVHLRDRYVFDYWRKFHSVSVGASLDAMGPRAEYIRKGTVWSNIEDNRRRMLDTCPNVDFYISPTVSILNALHVPDFHQDWVERGLLKHQDLNINLLQDPTYLRLDIATKDYKQRIKSRIEDHLSWLSPYDKLQRASGGFLSLIAFMEATDNSSRLPIFWQRTQQLDKIRREYVLEVIPELSDLK